MARRPKPKRVERYAPVFYTVKQVQHAAGLDHWPRRRFRDWLHRANVLERRWGTLVATPERLVEGYPEIYRRLLEMEDEEE